MDFAILGPVEASRGGQPIAVGGPKQRALLAILLLHANEVVSRDRLIDGLWGEQPPPRARQTLETYVSRLRRALGPDRVMQRSSGYSVQVESEELDLQRFERLVSARQYREALALWRGPALADLLFEPFAAAEAERLEERRLVATEERIDEELTAGAGPELVAELEKLVSVYPLRERLLRQLMLALYRAGRQAAALETYRSAQRRLAEELGLAPSPDLRELERSILEHDPSLMVRPAPAASANGHPPAESSSILVGLQAAESLDALLALAGPLAAAAPGRELILVRIVDSTELGRATAALGAAREQLGTRGVPARVAAFASPSPAADIVRLASQHQVELLILDAGRSPLAGTAGAVVEQAQCDVALLLESGGPPRPGPVVVPFGGADHDWLALDLGASVSRALAMPLRLIGAASGDLPAGRDASRLLADASLILQRTTGVLAEPLLAPPGRQGVMAMARDAGLLVVGLSERWPEEGLGLVRAEIAANPPAPTVLVRRDLRSADLDDPERTRFRWSLSIS